MYINIPTRHSFNILLPVHALLPYNAVSVQGGSVADSLYTGSPWSPADTRLTVATHIRLVKGHTHCSLTKGHLFNVDRITLIL